MEFRVYKTTTKKRGDQHHIHTASCPVGDRLKKKTSGTFLKLTEFAYAEDAAEAMEKTLGTKPTVHAKCVRLFRRPVNTNPPCPKCGTHTAVFQSNMGVGKKEFTCTTCKQLFVHIKPKREATVKIKLSKKQKTTSKKLTKDERKAARVAARQQRKDARIAAREERRLALEAKVADRKNIRIVRTMTRIDRLITKLHTLGVDTTVVQAWLTPQLPKKAKGTKKAAPKKAAKKTAPKKK